ncbi:MAG TPA: TIGR03435 family protein [Candidatus Acidoferrales bacterium]|nr:TIGR03435 family protein [Candidatus Acidoferrales bacterium]
MTLTDLSPLANHIWQSTIFAIAAWLLTLALRKNRASVRYWVWFSASLKFLIPFSLLVSIGNKFAWHSSTAITQPQLAIVINQISQPFATFTEVSTAMPPTHASGALPIILLATWLWGVIVILIFWFRSLRQMRAIKRTASPLPLSLSIPVMSSSAHMEPGVFGILNPVLILPEGIADRLSPAQMNAVIAHELCHVQRKDNLTAAIHMAVETTFWFHPIVWWIRTQLVAERERSCDESVVGIANDPQIYAEAILSVCKHYIESPLRCVSGVSGSDLKRRIRAIVTGRVGGELTYTRKAVLVFAAAAALAAPVLVGAIASSAGGHSLLIAAMQDTEAAKYEKFVAEVVTIKPGDPSAPARLLGIGFGGDKFGARNATLMEMVRYSYSLAPRGEDGHVTGGPNWDNSDRYDVDAKMEPSVAEALWKLPPEQRFKAMQHLMLAILKDRCQLSVHRDVKELPVFTLVIAKGGPKLKEASPEELVLPAPDSDARGGYVGPRLGWSRGSIAGQATTIPRLVNLLQMLLGRTVIDNTGLTGSYDFTVQYTPDEMGGAAPTASPTGAEDQSASIPGEIGPSLFTALQEQLGLKLQSGKGPVEIIVIDHVERPSPN